MSNTNKKTPNSHFVPLSRAKQDLENTVLLTAKAVGQWMHSLPRLNQHRKNIWVL
jgi:hypothetical protein